MDASSSRRFLFVHVMKTAGTTFAQYIKTQFPGRATYPNRGADWTDPADVEPYVSIERLLSLPAERRADIRIYAGHFPYMVADRLGPGLFTLTMLREPVARTISMLRQLSRLDPRYRGLPLEAIYEDERVSQCFLRDHQTKVFSLVEADAPRSILKPVVIDDARFRLASENLARVDVVGLTEEFGAFVDELRGRLGWWPAGLDPANRANAGPPEPDVDAAFRRRIAAENAYDVAFYELAVDLVARRRAARA